MNFTEAFETLTQLYESVSPDNPFLGKALALYKNDSTAKGVVVSARKAGSGAKEEEIVKVYHSTDELNKIIAEVYEKFGQDTDISAIHDRGMIKTYEDELAKTGKAAGPAVSAVKAKYTPAQLTAMRQNNKRIISATKIAGLDVASLEAAQTDKNGKQYKKASPELNKMRKALFGESKE